MRVLAIIGISGILGGCALSFESARIMCVTPPIVRVSLGAEDGVKEGEEFSVWRRERRRTGEVTYGEFIYRVGEIRIFRVENGETSLAEVIQGKPELGDRVTKWLILDQRRGRVLGR